MRRRLHDLPPRRDHSCLHFIVHAHAVELLNAVKAAGGPQCCTTNVMQTIVPVVPPHNKLAEATYACKTMVLGLQTGRF